MVFKEIYQNVKHVGTSAHGLCLICIIIYADLQFDSTTSIVVQKLNITKGVWTHLVVGKAWWVPVPAPHSSAIHRTRRAN